MIDYRMKTFLTLCQELNCRRTAERLFMTQPAVTQHIHLIEAEYNIKLFDYNGRQLSKTEDCIKLEEYLKSATYNELAFKKSLEGGKKKKVAIGATKTIGDYVVDDKILELLKNPNIELEFVIDNTQTLLSRLDSFTLDILLVEGFFDKAKYGYQLIKKEKLVGLCNKEHPFNGQHIKLEDTIKERLLLREQGSGTRAVFENAMLANNYKLSVFENKVEISSFHLIKEAIAKNYGISFVYESFAKRINQGIFYLEDINLTHEFNYVYLKDTSAKQLIELIKL